MKKTIGKFFLFLISILITLLVLELYVRNEAEKTTTSPGILEKITTVSKEEEWKTMVLAAQVKPSTYNIYYFGESTMKGEPYLDTIPLMVAELFNQRIAGKEVKWVNFAVAGSSLSDSQERLEWTLSHRDLTQPSLLIVYAGHNEFLKFHDCCGFQVSETYGAVVQKLVDSSKLIKKLAKSMKLYRVEIKDRSFFDVPVTSLEGFSNTLNQYQQMLSDMANRSEAEEVPLIISTVAGNYVDFEPNRSVFCQNNQDKQQFERVMRKGMEAKTKGQFNAAATNFLEALYLCDQFAETHFQLGETYRALGLNDQAWEEYQKAVDFDRMPIRAQTTQNAFIKSMQETSYVHTVDAVATLRQQSHDGLIGRNLMIDGHHPNLSGYQIISELIAQKIAEITNAKLSEKADIEKVKQAFMTNDWYRKHVFLYRAEWFIHLSTWRYDSTNRLKVAEEYLDEVDAVGLQSARQFVLRMLIAIMRQDEAKANAYLMQAKKLDAEETDRLLKDEWIGLFVKRITFHNHHNPIVFH